MRSLARLGLVGLCLGLYASFVLAVEVGSPRFQSTWERTDYPVAQTVAARSWTWGPMPNSAALNEAYLDSPGGRRVIQYFDKSRMEINNPDADGDWAVTNGLLVNEMISGLVQTGDNAFIPLSPATISVAGDSTNTFPTYADLERVYAIPPQLAIGGYADRRFTRTDIDVDARLRSDATKIVEFQGDYGIPQVFYDFMNQRGTIYTNGSYQQNQRLWDPTYVFGLPITEPYWVNVMVGGVQQDVLFQAFERRVITYTPANAEAWRVEMGNVGQHYWKWRYEQPFANGQKAFITNPSRTEVPTISSPVLIQGFENGQAFEASISIRIRLNDGTILAENSTMVTRPDVNIPGPFELVLDFEQPSVNTPAFIEVVVYSMQGGNVPPTVLDSIPVILTRKG